MSYLFTKEQQAGVTEAIKKSVRAASNATNYILGNTHTAVDGVTLADGDRVLLKDQSTASENGIYTWASGTQMFTRADDSITSALLVAVEEGVQASTVWTLATANPITVDTTALSFSQVGGGGGGDVTGPAGSTDNTVALFNGGTGKIIKEASGVTIDGSANLAGINNITLTGTVDGVDVGAHAAAPNPHNTDLNDVLAVDNSLGGNSLGFPTTSISDALDEDNMASDSATAVATQQSIKAYVDNNTSFRDQIFVESVQEVTGVEATKFLASFPFNPGDWEPGTSKEFRFGAVLSVSDGALTGEVELYNLTDAELVTLTGGTLTTSSTGAVKLESGALTVGAAAGNLKNTEKIYEVRIKNDGTLASEKTFLGSAWILIS